MAIPLRATRLADRPAFSHTSQRWINLNWSTRNRFSGTPLSLSDFSLINNHQVKVLYQKSPWKKCVSTSQKLHLSLKFSSSTNLQAEFWSDLVTPWNHHLPIVRAIAKTIWSVTMAIENHLFGEPVGCWTILFPLSFVRNFGSYLIGVVGLLNGLAFWKRWFEKSYRGHMDMKYSMTSLESHVESTHLARYTNIPIQCD